MIKFLKKPYRWAALFSILLIATFAFALLDTFVVPKALTTVESPSVTEEEPDATSPQVNREETEDEPAASPPDEAIITATSYEDANIKIAIETARKYDTTFYVADVRLSDASYLKTALAQNTYGRNIKETTSAMAEKNHAIFAVNGDYYGFRDSGYVLRNGVLYRDTSNSAAGLVIDNEGDFFIVNEDKSSAQSLLARGAQQVFSFGPVLVEKGEIAVDANSEVSQSKSSNPRTAIGQISYLHYIIIVSDGRTDESRGLSLLELAEQFAKRGAAIAYNLDGGGSSAMYFNGEVVNNPTDGRHEKERAVSDIVYIGYQ